ncbi:MAG: hypothetical protein P3M73_00235 [Candidatus Hodgkinia cicadicola]|nr:MAG: hypothetical protein P3M73_00235 [Candidatus Hodgkinia cicadicola]
MCFFFFFFAKGFANLVRLEQLARQHVLELQIWTKAEANVALTLLNSKHPSFMPTLVLFDHIEFVFAKMLLAIGCVLEHSFSAQAFGILC